MGYTIEISNDVRKPNKLIKNMQERREMAEDHMCEMQYFCLLYTSPSPRD